MRGACPGAELCSLTEGGISAKSCTGDRLFSAEIRPDGVTECAGGGRTFTGFSTTELQVCVDAIEDGCRKAQQVIPCFAKFTL